MAFVFNKQCKLCKLIEKDAALWWEVHRRIMDDEASMQSVMRWLAQEIDKRNLEYPGELYITPISYSNFQNHFKKGKHVPSLQVAREACSDGTDDTIPVSAVQALGSTLPEAGGEVRDLMRMKQLIFASERRLHEYNNRVSKLEAKEVDPLKLPSLDELAIFQKMVKDLLNLKKEATKVEQGEAVAGEAVREGMSLLVEETLKVLEKTMDELYSMLTRELPGSKLPDQVVGILRMQVGEVVKGAVPLIVDLVHKRYSIK